MKIDAKEIHYKELNEKIRAAIRSGETEIFLEHINGHRYIGGNLGDKVKIIINGVPGNDLGSFMNGPEIIVNGNGQDGIGNTMSSGKIVIHGLAGDIVGYGMRGGRIFIEGDVGYRVGIHMKEYKDVFPVIVIGGKAGDFLGEYMAGGVLVVLGMNSGDEDIVGDFCGTGMHGGKIYIRGKVPSYKLGQEVTVHKVDSEDTKFLKGILDEYSRDLGITLKINPSEFTKLVPGTSRPYGKLYAY